VHKDGIQRGKRSGLDLVIEGSGVKDKFLVLVNGTRVNLPAKSFKYLVKLTWALFPPKADPPPVDKMRVDGYIKTISSRGKIRPDIYIG
jgi:hypothetical protein